MIEPNSFIVFSDDAIRRFLLGELTVTEQTAFENRLVADDELEARVRLSELGLADDYVQRRLTRAESLRVQERFLVTRDRQHMAAVSQALRDRFTPDRKSTRLNSQSPMYLVCRLLLEKKKTEIQQAVVARRIVGLAAGALAQRRRRGSGRPPKPASAPRRTLGAQWRD